MKDEKFFKDLQTYKKEGTFIPPKESKTNYTS